MPTFGRNKCAFGDFILNFIFWNTGNKPIYFRGTREHCFSLILHLYTHSSTIISAKGMFPPVFSYTLIRNFVNQFGRTRIVFLQIKKNKQTDVPHPTHNPLWCKKEPNVHKCNFKSDIMVIFFFFFFFGGGGGGVYQFLIAVDYCTTKKLIIIYCLHYNIKKKSMLHPVKFTSSDQDKNCRAAKFKKDKGEIVAEFAFTRCTVSKCFKPKHE